MASGMTADPRPNAVDVGEKRRKFRAFEENKHREIEEGRLHRRYYYDKQWSDEEVRELKRRGQQPTVRNKISRKINFLVGVEQRMRRDPKAYPRTPKDQDGADVVTATLRFVTEHQRWDFKSSDATRDGLVSGIGVMFVGVQQGRKGIDVKLRVGQIDRFFYDSRSVEADFSDARHMGMHLWMDADEAKSRWPEQADRIQDLIGADGADGNARLAADTDRDEQWGDYEHNRLRVVEYWYKQLDGSWYYCFFSGDVELEAGVSPYLDENGVPECPYVCWSPLIDEVGDRHGLVRTMLTIQDEINHRASRILHRLQSRQMHMREGIVEDENELKRQMTRPDGIVKHHGIWGQDIGLVDNGQQIQGEAELLTLAQADIENLGPNPGLIGQGGGVADQSGRAILAQRDSGMTELSPIFERIRDWKLRVYRAIYNRIKQFWTEERFIRITDNPEAPRFIGINRFEMDPMTGQLMSSNVLSEIDVDVILDEGPDTITMQEELLQRITEMGEAALSPLGELIIELSGVAGKERYLEIIKRIREENGPPPPDPAQIEAAKLELREKNAQITKTEVEAQEKASQIPLNQARAMKEAAQANQPVPQPNGLAALSGV